MLERLKSIYHSLQRLHDIGRVQEKLRTLSIAAERRSLLAANPAYQRPLRLNRFEQQIFSQSGQDGIIVEIFRRIGVTNRVCVEFGVAAGGGCENNTTHLLAHGWTGCWIDGNPEGERTIRKNLAHLISAGRLRLMCNYVTAENIETLFDQLNVPAEFDLLSIDIDGNDLWVWKNIRRFRPRVVVIEYNAYLGAGTDWTVPYDPKRFWGDGSIEFGASLKALEKTGRDLGYSLVACDLSGSDAFFVRADLAKNNFDEPYDTANHYEPMRYHLIDRPGYIRNLSPAVDGLRHESL